MPEIAPSVKATPIPPSHFTNYRPDTKMSGNNVVKEGKVVGKDLGNTSDIKLAKVKKLNHLYNGRFNCSQCHAPQSTQEPLVKNTFTPEFTTKDGSSKSNLIDVINEGVQ
jgi:cytochrome c-type protein NapB